MRTTKQKDKLEEARNLERACAASVVRCQEGVLKAKSNLVSWRMDLHYAIDSLESAQRERKAMVKGNEAPA